ncbi:NAD(P)H-hydrate repair Nnr-like enzyme with NAD(P)H-hydrate dehydratase domain [Methanococcus voltae]|uniref:YjeF C-terminal domain-containing protein n=2 Tax=Methanococcus voltae TaxID=2188 RepID=D7DUF6_METV3|nr:NAD(P)H-hydrate repair Nnr-like enzyme with NAD(P)H-hydrate dehydratase domain [Methanococcus voltae]
MENNKFSEMVIAGTIPIHGLGLTKGNVEISFDNIRFYNENIPENTVQIPISMGTATLIASCYKTLQYFNRSKELIAILAGDIGDGDGSAKIYDEISHLNNKFLIVHYIKPKISEISRVDFERNFVVGDAGGMYAGKAAGIGDKFKLFLPDVGELAFLADKDSSHPAYVRGFISEVDDLDVVKLIKMAYETGKMPDNMIVKGETDYIVEKGEIIASVSEPKHAAMECIGGTGDNLTGIISGLIYCGYEISEACTLGCLVNREIANMIKPTPDTKINEIIDAIPDALDKIIE